jgi:hypothetical protein
MRHFDFRNRRLTKEVVMKFAPALVFLTLIAGRAAAEEGAPKPAHAKISVKNLSCGDYLGLPDDIRPVIAGWVHGFYYRESWKDAWELDPERARSILSALNDACKDTPLASFRYKLTDVVKKIHSKATP